MLKIGKAIGWPRVSIDVCKYDCRLLSLSAVAPLYWSELYSFETAFLSSLKGCSSLQLINRLTFPHASGMK